jgi:hypothetical protein
VERTLRKVGGVGLVLVLITTFTTKVCAQKNSPPPSAARSGAQRLAALPTPGARNRHHREEVDAVEQKSGYSRGRSHTYTTAGQGWQQRGKARF